METRNIAIIAHVDHGKTTLTDAIMRRTGMFEAGMSMDANAIERERGITIYAKNTGTFYKGTKINIIDTPGHADFGSEVERVLRSIDCVLLIVDAQEGPMPQTRFVLKKSLELGHKPIVVLNKIDKPAANPHKAEEEVLELFMELGATDEQMNFTTVYAIGKDAVAMRKLDDPRESIDPLLDVVLEKVPVATGDATLPLRAQPFNLGYDNFMGRLAVCRVYEGRIKVGETLAVKSSDGRTRQGKVTKLFTFKGTAREEVPEIAAGDIGLVAGFPDVYIGDTLCASPDAEALPSIHVDEPTITLDFLVNGSPFVGRSGKLVNSRQIRERLEKELEINVGLKVDLSETDRFKVYGRGELHIAVLLENMRREGYELAVSQPQVIVKEIDGQKMEPFEEITVDVPSEFQGVVIEKLGLRKAIMKDMKVHDTQVRMVFEGPTRGLLGYRGVFVVDTRGDGIMASRVIGFQPFAGDIEKKPTGSMVSMATGKALGFSLWGLQDRGQLYITPGMEVYEGQVVGNTSKGDEMVVNPTKGKAMSNVRSSGNDEAIVLFPALEMTIERGLETMSEDELLEVTPAEVRLRKRYLTDSDRARAKRADLK
jgi:GTP-binding protein